MPTPTFIAENSLLRAVYEFAADAHENRYKGGTEPQLRKYTLEPYIVHPTEVATLLFNAGVTDSRILAAALLHDVVEDTDVELDEITERFGKRVGALVGGVTDPDVQGTREARQAQIRVYLERQDADSQLIKLADIVSNTRDIFTNDPDFAVIYSKEKASLLKQLIKPVRFTEEANKFFFQDAGKHLYNLAVERLRAYYEEQLNAEFDSYWAESPDADVGQFPTRKVARRAYEASFWKRKRPSVVLELESISGGYPQRSVKG